MKAMRLFGKGMVVTTLGAILVGLGFGIMLWMHTTSEAEILERDIEITQIDADNLPALREWAESWCRGWKLDDLAASLGVDSTIDAVGGYLARNLPEESRRAVMEVCERELSVDAEGTGNGFSTID